MVRIELGVACLVYFSLPHPLTSTLSHVSRGASAAGVRNAAAPATSPISMKVFDWKKRSDTYSEESEFKLHNLRPAPGSAHRKIRKGRGMGSGKGGPGGFGMRGQLSRGGRPTRPGFEGGQTPLYRRIPKLRGKPMGPGHTKTVYGLIKVSATRSHFNAAEPLVGSWPGCAMKWVRIVHE